MSNCGRVLLLVALLGSSASALASDGEILHRERSLYRNISVSQIGDRRCMHFETRSRVSNQSCMYVSDPYKLVFEYTRLTFAGFLVNPSPERVLIVGLGGGGIQSVFQQAYPQIKVETVEIDPAVHKLAEEYFDFQETESNAVHIQDARVFVKRLARRGERFDYIILDAFSGDYIPEHLMTREFLLEVRSLLTEGGVLVANTFSASGLYHNESVTYEAAYGRLVELFGAESGNRVILAARDPQLLDAESMQANLRQLSDQHKIYGVDYAQLLAGVSRERRWRRDARVLTDQYSPANILQQRQ